MIDFYFHNRKAEAVSVLEAVIPLLSISDLNYIKVLNTLLNFYYDTGDLTRFSEVQEHLESGLSRLNLNIVEELELFIKFHYNVCRYLWLQNHIEEAITKISATIEQCKKYRTIYLLADLYVLMGNVSKNFSSNITVKEYFDTARFLYKLEENMSMALKVEHYIAEMREQ